MKGNALDRRALIRNATGLGAVMAVAGLLARVPDAALADEATDGVPFEPDGVRRLAEAMASRGFEKPRVDVPAPFDKLSYDQYRDIRFRAERAIWRNEGLGVEMQLFALGYLYDVPVNISIVDKGRAVPLKADDRLFSIGPLIGRGNEQAPYGFSGFRLHGPINRADHYDEYLLFQGASYFRAVGRNQRYGLSARGLAIGTARPTGEEFPFFKSFWIERPAAAGASVTIHALLDSPSTTGAYTFVVSPGPSTVIDVDFTLYPRRELSHVGLAPLTSMYRHGTAQNRLPSDYRPGVHDSEGLAILNGRGEHLWRPLTNPRTLQTSAFIDKDPKGFGLVQLDRNFTSYQDLEARYEWRPSVWIEPKGGWGEGFVELIEIPTEAEIHDNIVAYWKPATPLGKGLPHRYGYRMHWCKELPVAWSGVSVVKTRVGIADAPETRLFVIDFTGGGARSLGGLPRAEVAASGGAVANLVVQENPEINGMRVSFELKTAGTDMIELRLGLKVNDRLISESWLYRWTRS
ncbi:MAG: glucan biosynthesis protein G [Hyphomicrobiaceae bacterium]|nr:glucan biosynthesis protein G [Hyphomicrobiaceae bacterium]